MPVISNGKLSGNTSIPCFFKLLHLLSMALKETCSDVA